MFQYQKVSNENLRILPREIDNLVLHNSDRLDHFLSITTSRNLKMMHFQ